ncbi:MAG: PEGA domain-containing protein [Candidatus Roizmanbacteria bacterium]|nr:PEGA domain-containing protein [Candidatus Roizmanbacteria bacterium]
MKQGIFSLLVILLLAASAAIVILLARGYRFNPQDNSLDSTGILVTKSEPDGAQVYIDGIFSGATNSTINLLPNWYKVRISKQGYHDWEREMRIQGEIVVQTDAVLFLKNPSLSVLTSTGVLEPFLSPDGTKIAYIATPSAEQLTQRPDEGTEGESIFESNLRQPTLFIYDLNGRNLPFSRNPQPYPGTLNQLLEEWELERETSNAISLRSMPAEFQQIATDSIRLLSFAPDGSKVLYEATAAATLKRTIEPPLIGGLSTEEERELNPHVLYVYDMKDDRNYHIDFSVNYPDDINVPLPIQWIGTSRHFVLVEDGKISVMEYDGANKIPVYSGPFVNGYVFPHPVGHQLIILTTFNPELGDLPSLYTLTIR